MMQFFKRKTAEVAPPKELNDSLPVTNTPTPAGSEVNVDTEKDIAFSSSSRPSTSSKKEIETNGLEEAEALENFSEEPEYPSGAKLAVISLALCLSVFLVALDNTIIAVASKASNLFQIDIYILLTLFIAVPKITDQFNALDDVGWYGSAYLLTTCAFQLLFGKFYTFFSIKWVYLIAIAIFEVGSVVCGAAPTSNALIGKSEMVSDINNNANIDTVGRAVAGLGSAGIFSGALVIIAYTVPLAKRPMCEFSFNPNFNVYQYTNIMNSHRFHRSHVRNCICCWSSHGRRLHRPRLLEMVLLHQPPDRSRNFHRDHAFL